MKPLRYTIACCLLIAPAYAADDPPAASADAPVEFQFVAREGDSSRLKITTRTFGSMSMFGAMVNQKFSQQFEQHLVMTCIEVKPDKSSVFEMTLPEMSMRMNMGGLQIEIDTRDKARPVPATNPAFELLHRVFASMTKVKCTVTFSATGEPLKVEGLSKGMESVLDEVSDQLLPGMKQFFDQFRDYLADNIMEEQMRSAFRLVPDGGRARVGDRWVREWNIKMPPFNVMTQGKGEYELLGIEEFRGKPCVKIRTRSSMTTLPGQKPDVSSAGGAPKGLLERMQFSMTASGGNGTAYVDFTTGDLMQLRETQRSTIEMSMEPDAEAADSELKPGLGKITQRLTTSVQIDLVEKNGKRIVGENPDADRE